MADNPAEPTPEKDKFAPKNVAADPKKNDDHHAGFKGRDTARGSEEATRGAGRERG